VRTRVRVACERCGAQQLPARALTLRCCEDDGATSVRFSCTRCGLVHVTAVAPEQASALAGVDDVGFESWRRPSEQALTDAAASITEAEIDAWRTMLDDDEVVGDAIESLDPGTR